MGSSPDYSKSKARSVQPSRFPADDGWLDRCDKAATRLVSSMSLPLIVECAISCPGCFFGMPAFLLVGPTIVDCLVDGAAPWLAAAATSALAGVWLAGVHPAVEHKHALAALYSPYVMTTAPVFGALLSGSVARYAITLWLCGMVPVVDLKRVARRRRPVTFPYADAEAKKLPRIARSLRASDPNASFPSGDVAGATAFCLALLPTRPGAAAACVALSAFGRLFYHAHHVVDVVFGACITAAAHFALGAAGIEPASTLWWTPIAAEAAALPMMKLLSTWENQEH